MPKSVNSYNRYFCLLTMPFQNVVNGSVTDLVEPFGMDECWLDVTGSTKIFGSAMDIAEISGKQQEKN